MFNSKFYKISITIILVLIIIFLCIKIQPVLEVFFEFITSLLYPTLIAVVLYYALRPLRNLLERYRMPRIAAIISLYLWMYIFVSFMVIFIWPFISEQIAEFSHKPVEKLNKIESKAIDILNIFNIRSVTHEQIRETLMNYLKEIMTLIYQNLIFTISSIAKIASFLVITPFILFYLLKNDLKLSQELVDLLPKGYKRATKNMVNDIDETLSFYISGQVLVAIIVGVLIGIGYLIIGLNYAILLASIALIFNLIPFCGPLISTVPALLIGFSESPFMALKVIIVVLLIHLLDLNIISPRIVGLKLNIHPVTVIFLLVASLSVFGIVGMFLIIPTYSVLKVITIRYFTNLKEEN